MPSLCGQVHNLDESSLDEILAANSNGTQPWVRLWDCREQPDELCEDSGVRTIVRSDLAELRRRERGCLAGAKALRFLNEFNRDADTK